jgi:hypothetical protein
MRDAELTFVGNVDFDIVALFQFECVDHGGRKASRQTVAPFCDPHWALPVRYTLEKT